MIHLLLSDYYLQIKILIFITLYSSREDWHIKKNEYIQICRLLISAKKSNKRMKKKGTTFDNIAKTLCADDI